MNKEKTIKQDNLDYTFTPGKDGSLTAPAPKKPSLIEMLSQDKPRMAKTIMPPPQTPVKMFDGGDPQDAKNQQLMDWVKNVPGGTSVESPQPQTVQAPVDTNSGSKEEQESMKDNNESRIQKSDPGHASEDLLGAETAQKMADAGKYGPDQEKAVMDAIRNSQGSLRNRFARAGAGLGDAIMGVAGKQSPGFLKILEDRENTQAERAINANPLLQKMNAEKMAEQERLEGQGANTPLVNAKRQVMLPIAKQIFPGKTDAEYAKMIQLPDEFAKTAGIPAQVLESKAKIAMAGAELGLHKEVAGENVKNQKTERKLAAEKQLSDLGIAGRFLHPDQAKELEAIVKGEESGNGMSQNNQGPFGATTVKNGKTYEWSQSTGKYHLKQ